MGYDFIGDIHGQAGKLGALLNKLGYVETGKTTWTPPQGRQAVFLGDLIDRGPEQVKVVNIVRSMIDAGSALSIMGNHEFNAIGYVTEPAEVPGGFLRRHTDNNVSQHAEFLRQVGEGSELHRDMVTWFRTLPPFVDLGGARVVHAWWHQPFVDVVTRGWPAGTPMSDEFLRAAYARGSPEFEAMEGLTKGLEITLPDGYSFVDHSGKERTEVRTRWWMENARTYRDVAIVGSEHEHRMPETDIVNGYLATPVTGSPVFIGHYWMEGLPQLLSPKVACLDWSAAKAGPLVAYRWDGEQELEASRFVAAG